MYEVALSILKKITDNGYEAYIVGGYPRDKYLGIDSYDIDICTSATPDIIESLFKIEKQYKNFGVSVIKYKGYCFEVTTFRRDSYQNTRYPKIEFVSTLEEDLERRDFIMNTLCINKHGEYVDILGARYDIENKIIRTVGDSDLKIKEDILRIIRALKFKTKLQFKIDESLEKSIQKYSKDLKNINFDRIERELKGIDKYQIQELLGNIKC